MRSNSVLRLHPEAKQASCASHERLLQHCLDTYPWHEFFHRHRSRQEAEDRRRGASTPSSNHGPLASRCRSGCKQLSFTNRCTVRNCTTVLPFPSFALISFRDLTGLEPTPSSTVPHGCVDLADVENVLVGDDARLMGVLRMHVRRGDRDVLFIRVPEDPERFEGSSCVENVGLTFHVPQR